MRLTSDRVCTAAGDRVPGPRSYALLAPVEFPWRAAIDAVEEVGSYDSYSLSLDLTRNGLVCGPSSGLNLRGLHQLLEKRRAAGTLGELAGPDGEVHCVFLCCDLPYQYVNEYFDKLGAAYFAPIDNEVRCDRPLPVGPRLRLTTSQELLGVDTHRYDERWERTAADALDDFYGVDEAAMGDALRLAPRLATGDGGVELDGLVRRKPGTAVIDLREAADFARFHLPGSANVPLVRADAAGPFSDAAALAALWRRLEAAFAPPRPELAAAQRAQRVLLLCYDGDSARVATSVLRARGCAADSVRGGFRALACAAAPPQGAPWLQLSCDGRPGPPAVAQAVESASS